MAMAICFKCGSEKLGALLRCASCNVAPQTRSEHSVSLALSVRFALKKPLAQYSLELRNGLQLSLPREALRQVPSMSVQRRHSETALHQSPFAVLGATTRDDRRRIVELAEEKSLELDHEVCQKARSDLTNPRSRLSVEMAWLPGVSPRKAAQLLDSLLQTPMSIREESGLPTLARLNLLAAAFEFVDGEHDPDDFAGFIREVAYLADELSPNEVVRDINEDRTVSGFSEVKALEQIEAELAERKRYYRNTIKSALNRLPPAILVQVMTNAVDIVTVSGEEPAPELIDELVDSYEVECQGFLRNEAENVHKLIKAIRELATAGEAAVKPHLDKLDVVARNWDDVAQPIQLSAKARGIEHEASRDLAHEIRSLAIELFNKHDMLEQSQRLTGLLRIIFAEIPDVSECVEQDSVALRGISQNREEAAALDPIRALVSELLKDIERTPSDANREGLRLLKEGQELLRAAPIKAASPAYREARNLLAAGIMRCAIAYGNETSKWEPCIHLLESALELASDASLRLKLNENLSIVRANHESLSDVEPIRSAPSLSTVNGIGTTLYGSSDAKPDGSYMATYYFVFLAIPIFPIARYRVIRTNGGYRFLGQGRLRVADKWHLAITFGLIALLLFKG